MPDELAQVEQGSPVGRVLRSSTTSFTVGCRQVIAAPGQLDLTFGALVKAAGRGDDATYGLVYNVAIEDDAFVRQLVAAGVDSPEIIEDQRQRRQVPVVADVLAVGYNLGSTVSQRLPPQPPPTLDPIFACTPPEVVRFTERHDWLRIVLAAADVPADQLLAAALRAAAGARPPGLREPYLVDACRELARLLALDLVRLEGILGQLR